MTRAGSRGSPPGPLDPALYSHGSAIVNTLQQLAGAAGAAAQVTGPVPAR